MSTTLATSTTGSRLYGTAHENSDTDTLELYLQPLQTLTGLNDSKSNSHLLNGDTDHRRWELAHFLRQLRKGSPQSLEFLFSLCASGKLPDCELFMNPWLLPDWENALQSHMRCAESFLNQGGRKGRLHCFRLCNQFKKFMNSDSEAFRMSSEELAKFELMDSEDLKELLGYSWEMRDSASNLNRYRLNDSDLNQLQLDLRLQYFPG